jgi:hypothetical protein
LRPLQPLRDDLRIYDGPTPRMKELRESAGRVRFLDDEQRALLEAAPERSVPWSTRSKSAKVNAASR